MGLLSRVGLNDRGHEDKLLHDTSEDHRDHQVTTPRELSAGRSRRSRRLEEAASVELPALFSTKKQ